MVGGAAAPTLDAVVAAVDGVPVVAVPVLAGGVCGGVGVDGIEPIGGLATANLLDATPAS
jgi:hypothetical protein